MDRSDIWGLFLLDRLGFGLIFLFHRHLPLLHGPIGHAFVQGNILIDKGQKGRAKVIKAGKRPIPVKFKLFIIYRREEKPGIFLSFGLFLAFFC